MLALRDGMTTVVTVRDFSVIFDAYSQLEESMLALRMENIDLDDLSIWWKISGVFTRCKDVVLKLAWLVKPPPLPPEICHNRSFHIGNDVSVSEEKASRRLFWVLSNPNCLDGLPTYSHFLVLYINGEFVEGKLISSSSSSSVRTAYGIVFGLPKHKPRYSYELLNAILIHALGRNEKMYEALLSSQRQILTPLTYNALIGACAGNDDLEKTLNLMARMRRKLYSEIESDLVEVDGHPSGGYSSYTGGPQGHGFSFRPEGWQSTGEQGGSQSFSGSSGFNLNDIFSNMFGGNMQGGSQFGGFGGSTRSQAGPRSSNDGLGAVASQVFKKEISDKGRTWLLLAYTAKLKGKEYYESIVQEVANMLSGAIKVGSINCQAEQSFATNMGSISSEELSLNFSRAMLKQDKIYKQVTYMADVFDEYDTGQLKEYEVNNIFSGYLDGQEKLYFDIMGKAQRVNSYSNQIITYSLSTSGKLGNTVLIGDGAVDDKVADLVFLVGCISKFLKFSSPRPPEVADLEDNVDFERGRNVTHSNKQKYGDLSIIC
ncbi:hypothetical protein QQ045_001429 [Rhodiola kirilowii]